MEHTAQKKRSVKPKAQKLCVQGSSDARTIAAIAAAITATVGRAPKKLIVTTPEGEITRIYNSWSFAGRQDLMEVGGLQGQRGFQY